MLGNHKGFLHVELISVGDLYRLKITIAFLIQSLDLFTQLVVGFPIPLGEGTSPLRFGVYHRISGASRINVNRT